MIEQIEKAYLNHFGTLPDLVVRSPGRINLIGEHTDYNKGFVLPAAINRSIILAFGPRSDTEIHFYAENLGDSHTCSVNGYQKSARGWPNYLLGVLQQLEKRGDTVSGFNCLFGGDIPIGAGLSSSAALECGLLFGLNRLFSLKLSERELAISAQAAENEFVGVQCGIMDQFANVFGKKNQLIKLDCETLDFDYIPFRIEGYDIALCDTGVKHSLATSEYNTRRKECETGLLALRRAYPQISSLRAVSQYQLDLVCDQISETVYKRCKYVIAEIERVSGACEDLRRGDLKAFGEKMFATHDGLRDDYQVSCIELDFLVNQARSCCSVLGSRMMGGGFGGCTINLVRSTETQAFLKATEVAYQREFKRPLIAHIVSITDGVHCPVNLSHS